MCFFLFSFACATHKLILRVLSLLLCDTVASLVLPDIAFVARYLGCVVVLQESVGTRAG